MRYLLKKIKTHGPWLIMFLVTTLFFTFLVWLTDSKSFHHIVLALFLFMLLIVGAAFGLDWKIKKRQSEALQALLLEPDEARLKTLLAQVDAFWHPTIEALWVQQIERDNLIKNSRLELQNYQEFIEGWTHEIKTPLSLATLILANRKEEMSPYVYNRMNHVRWAITSDVERILYYARLQSDHIDYKFEEINLETCVMECLEAFYIISEEKGIDIQLNLKPIQVTSDAKVLCFIISQLLSNAFKYTSSDAGVVSLSCWYSHEPNDKIHLAVRDNGHGVPLEDLPFIFDKGFTGSHPGRQSATGLGLYLVNKYAQVLSIDVKIEPTASSDYGFGIQLTFPVVSATDSVADNDK